MDVKQDFLCEWMVYINLKLQVLWMYWVMQNARLIWMKTSHWMLIILSISSWFPLYSISVYQRRKQKRNGGCTSEKQTSKIITSFFFCWPHSICTFKSLKPESTPVFLTDAAFDCEVPVFQTQLVLHREVLIPDSPQCGNTEKANLIFDWPKNSALVKSITCNVQYKTVKMLHKPNKFSAESSVQCWDRYFKCYVCYCMCAGSLCLSCIRLLFVYLFRWKVACILSFLS